MRHVLPALLCLCAAPAAAQSCRIEASPLAFGRYDPAATRAAVVRGEIGVHCTAAGRAGTVQARLVMQGAAARRLTGPGAVLHYELFQDAALSRPWREDAPLLFVLDASARDAPAMRAGVYARLAPGQWVAPGSYVDQVVLRVEF